MQFLINLIIPFLVQQEFDGLLEELFQGNNKYIFIVTLIIAVLTIMARLAGFLSDLEDAEKGVKKIKKWLFFWKKSPKKLISSESDIKLSELSIITNPANEYIENPSNVDDLIDHIHDNVNPKQIIAITGTAGIGKTKLVEHICSNEINEDFKVQIYVDFETVNSPESRNTLTFGEILENAKKKMNAALGGIDRDDNYHSIARHFQTPTIIFIDNYEQVLENPELDQKIRKEIIQPFSENNHLIKILITSREKISWASFNFKVKELSNTTPEEAQNYTKEELIEKFTAVKLFCKIHNQLAKKMTK